MFEFYSVTCKKVLHLLSKLSISICSIFKALSIVSFQFSYFFEVDRNKSLRTDLCQ